MNEVLMKVQHTIKMTRNKIMYIARINVIIDNSTGKM